MKNCLYCGRDTKSDQNICAACKQKLLGPSQQIAQDSEKTQAQPQHAKENKPVIIKFNKNLAVLAAFAAPLIVIVLIISFMYVKKPYTSVLEEYFDGLKTADAAKIIDTYPQEYINHLQDISQDLESIITKNLSDNLKDYEQALGSDIRLNYEIVNAEKSEDGSIKTVLQKDYNISGVSEAYIIELEITIKSSQTSKSFNKVVDVIKIDDRWYISPTTSFVLIS